MLSCSSVRAVVVLFSVLNLALAHMEMVTPYAINSKYSSATPQNLIDYSNTSPLLADGSNFPCKGYQNQRPIITSTTYTAGNAYSLVLGGSATHGGGSCQISLSYDNGKTFKVIMSLIGGCPLAASYNFTVPAYAPGGTALLAWTWFNHIGNREIYMNCAWVDIETGSSSSTSKRSIESFDTLPYIWKANLPDQNSCATVEGVDPVFPDPGSQVEYADGLTANSAATTGNCNSPTPVGATYQDLAVPDDGTSDTSPSMSASSAAISSMVVSPSPLSSTATAITPTTSVIKTSTITVLPVPLATATNTNILSTFTSELHIATSTYHFTNTSISYTPYSSYLSVATATVSTPMPTTLLTQTSSQYALSSSSSATVIALSRSYVLPSSSTSSSASAVTTSGSYSSGSGISTTCDGAAMGSFKCLRNGVGFAVCNWGQWVDMGSVAAGTICTGDAGNAEIGAIATT